MIINQQSPFLLLINSFYPSSIPLPKGVSDYFPVVTNMSNWDGERLLRWQRERCGTVEKVHDILKNDLANMGATCQIILFFANAAWWRLNIIIDNTNAQKFSPFYTFTSFLNPTNQDYFISLQILSPLGRPAVASLLNLSTASWEV